MDYKRKRQGGTVLVEAVIVLPFFLMLLFGSIEMTYVFRAKNTLNLATVETARTGALNNARLEPMQQALSSGMTPIFMHGQSSELQRIKAYARAESIRMRMDSVMDSVKVINPTRKMFDIYKKNLFMTLAGETKERRYQVIPNDNLYWRPSNEQSISVNGKQLRFTLQDANLLKIKTVWCHRLLIPGLDRLIVNALNLSPNSAQQACNRVSQISNDYYIGLTSTAIQRMQSPVYFGN